VPKIQVHPVTIPKDKLDAAPEEERLTYLMAGNLANDLHILQKLLIVSINTAHDMGEPHGLPANGMSMLLVKLLAGRLYEGWNWLRSGANSHLGMRLALDKTSEAWACYREITGYFGRDNLINALRQKIGFHSDVETMRQGYLLLAEQQMTELIAEQRGNTFYGSADITSLGALCHLVKEDDVARALGTIADEVARVANLFGDLVVHIAVQFCMDVLDIDAKKQLEQVLEIDAPRLDELRFPFFADGMPKDVAEVVADIAEPPAA